MGRSSAGAKEARQPHARRPVLVAAACAGGRPAAVPPAVPHAALARSYWFFVNLQLALDRALMVLHLGGGESDAPIDVSVKARPAPSS